MDVGGPSDLKKALKSVKSITKKDKIIAKPTILTKEPKHSLRSRLLVQSDTSTSENSESELTSLWEGNKTAPSEALHTQSEPIRAKYISPLACPSGNQNVTVVADVHCTQGETIAPTPRASSGVPADVDCTQGGTIAPTLPSSSGVPADVHCTQGVTIAPTPRASSGVPADVHCTQGETIAPTLRASSGVPADVHCTQGGTIAPTLRAQKPVSSSGVPADVHCTQGGTIAPTLRASSGVPADVHCTQGGTIAPTLRAQKPVSSSGVPADVHCTQGETIAPTLRAYSGVPAEPSNVDEIAVDDGFTVIKTKKEPSKPKATPTAINTALPSSPTPQNQESGSSQHNTTQQKILPVVIHHHFQGDMTKLNKDFHTEFQPIGFTTYRMKAGIAYQTSTYQDYFNLQTFLKQHKVPFNLIKHKDSKLYRVVFLLASCLVAP
jgi:hypothetical protein